MPSEESDQNTCIIEEIIKINHLDWKNVLLKKDCLPKEEYDLLMKQI